VAERATTSVADVQLTWFERLPWRRIVLVLFSVAIVALVVVGTYRTLTLEGAKDTPEYWFNLVVFGIAQGAIYAMIALGYGLVYGILRMINFAHGEVFMVGAFGSYFFADAYAKSGFLESNPIAAIAIIMLVAMVCAGITAFLLERIVYRPLRNAPRLVPLISAIGASLFIQNSIRGFFGPQSRGYPKPSFLSGSWSIGSVEIPKMSVTTLVVVIVAMVVLQWYVSSTRTGRSMRAVAGDREIASLMGIDVDRVIVRTFVIGGLLAGIAGVLYAMTFESVDFFMGFFPGISAFTAAVLGGIGSIGGAALGGLLIGVIESVGPFLILTGFKVPSPASLKPAFTFLVLVVVLVYRPSGLLGTGDKEKV
jgi:branched-chain amino acid transport system permease protein